MANRYLLSRQGRAASLQPRRVEDTISNPVMRRARPKPAPPQVQRQAQPEPNGPEPVEAPAPVRESVAMPSDLFNSEGTAKQQSAPEATELGESMMQDTLQDIGTTAGFKAAKNVGYASLLGAPVGAAAKFAFKSLMAPMAGLNAVGDMAATGLDIADMEGRLENYGYDPETVDPAAMGRFRSEIRAAEDLGVPSAAQAGIRSEYGQDAFASDLKDEMENRSFIDRLTDRAKTLAGIVGDTTSTNVQVGNMTLNEKTAEKAKADPNIGERVMGLDPTFRGSFSIGRGADGGRGEGQRGSVAGIGEGVGGFNSDVLGAINSVESISPEQGGMFEGIGGFHSKSNAAINALAEKGRLGVLGGRDFGGRDGGPGAGGRGGGFSGQGGSRGGGRSDHDGGYR